MAFEQHLRQIQTQKLILSPEMRLYLRLLELPLLEMKTALEQALEENPTLEEAKDTSEEEPEKIEEAAETPEKESSELDFKEKFDELERLDDTFKESFYENEGPAAAGMDVGEAIKKHDYRESLLTKPSSLNDYLAWQIEMEGLSEEDLRAANEIIGNVNEDGYLTVSVEEIAKTLDLPAEKVTAVLAKVQELDPPGVAARDLRECLLLQLKRMDTDTALTQKIVSDNLLEVQRKDHKELATKYKVHENYIKEACQLIARLNPKPGLQYGAQEPITVVPDAIVTPSPEDAGTYTIEMQEENLPRIRVSPRYKQMLKDEKLDKKTREFVKEKIKAAMDFLDAFKRRKSTLRLITEAIVDIQRDFLDKGPAALKPLSLKVIAERTGLHESTVSRAISGKYISTPQGTLPYKRFFSTKIRREDGTDESQKSIIERIRAIIESEDKTKPLSDAKIVKILESEGIKVARRTVAKYREMLKILPTHLRKQS